jgi:hypothetical protein
MIGLAISALEVSSKLSVYLLFVGENLAGWAPREFLGGVWCQDDENDGIGGICEEPDDPLWQRGGELLATPSLVARARICLVTATLNTYSVTELNIIPQEVNMEIQAGATIEEIATGRMGRVQSTEGENPNARLSPHFQKTIRWHVKFVDDDEPKFKTFANGSELRIVKERPNEIRISLYYTAYNMEFQGGTDAVGGPRS